MTVLTSTTLGPLEREILIALWEAGPQTGSQILATLRRRRPIAHTTVTSTLSRLVMRELLTREQVKGKQQQIWCYTPRYASRGVLIAGATPSASAGTEALRPGAPARCQLHTPDLQWCGPA